MAGKDRIRIAGIFLLLLILSIFIVVSAGIIFRGVDVGSSVVAQALSKVTGSINVLPGLGSANYVFPSKETLNADVAKEFNPVNSDSKANNPYQLYNIPSDYNLYKGRFQNYPVSQISELDANQIESLQIPVLGLTYTLDTTITESNTLASLADDSAANSGGLIKINCQDNCPVLGKLIAGDILIIKAKQGTAYYKLLVVQPGDSVAEFNQAQHLQFSSFEAGNTGHFIARLI